MTTLSRMRKLFALPILLAVSGCAASNQAQRGAAIGTGLGALTGAIVGHQSGHKAEGALVGAVTGLAAGSLIGHAEDVENERDEYIAHANYVERSRNALTNMDVIRMAQNGLSDKLIQGSIRASGGRFNLRPEALIQLRQQRVSEDMILFMQQNNNIVGGGVSMNTPNEVGTAVLLTTAPQPRPPRLIVAQRPSHIHPRHGRHFH